MSLVFIDVCPRCNRPTSLGFGIPCANKLKNGSQCGYQMPVALNEFVAKVRDKIEKHANPPVGVHNGQVSYAPSTGAYIKDLTEGRDKGSIYLDTEQNYFFSYLTPQGNKPIAVLCPGSGLPPTTASGFKMPLNSPVQNLHGHYANLDSGNIFVATSAETVIERPNAAHPDLTHIIQSGKVVATWDHIQHTGFAGTHLLL